MSNIIQREDVMDIQMNARSNTHVETMKAASENSPRKSDLN